MFTGPVVIISKLGWKEQFISLSTVDTRPDALRDGVLSTVGYLRASWLLPPDASSARPPLRHRQKEMSPDLCRVSSPWGRGTEVSPVNTTPISAGIWCWEDTRFMFWIEVFECHSSYPCSLYWETVRILCVF